jgi:hypothetical protein
MARGGGRGDGNGVSACRLPRRRSSLAGPFSPLGSRSRFAQPISRFAEARTGCAVCGPWRLGSSRPCPARARGVRGTQHHDPLRDETKQQGAGEAGRRGEEEVRSNGRGVPRQRLWRRPECCGAWAYCRHTHWWMGGVRLASGSPGSAALRGRLARVHGRRIGRRLENLPPPPPPRSQRAVSPRRGAATRAAQRSRLRAPRVPAGRPRRPTLLGKRVRGELRTGGLVQADSDQLRADPPGRAVGLTRPPHTPREEGAPPGSARPLRPSESPRGGRGASTIPIQHQDSRRSPSSPPVGARADSDGSTRMGRLGWADSDGPNRIGRLGWTC